MSSIIPSKNKRLSKKHAARVESLLQGALTKHQTGFLEEAENSYKSILKKYPDYLQAKHLLGVVSFQLGNPDKAIELLEDTVSSKPDFLDAQNNLGNIYFQCGKFENASSIFKRIIQINPNSASAYFNLANVFIKTTQTNNAIQNYEKALSLKPDYAEAHNNIGTAYLTLESTEQALEHFEQAVRTAPGFADAYNNAANCLKKLSRYEEAINYYNQAIKLKPDFVIAYSNLGNIYQELGNIENAINYYKQTLALDPNDSDTHFRLSRILQENGQIEGAVIHLKKTLEIKPEHYQAHNNLGNIYYQNSLIEEAIREFKIALQINADYAEAYNNWGNVLFESGCANEAIEKYKKALNLKPDLSQAHKHIAIIQPDKNQIETIQQQLNKPDLNDFDSMNYHFALGAIYNHIKSYSVAFKHYDKGNKLKRKTFDYDADEHSKYVNSLINVFSKEYFQNNNLAGSDSERPVFILGMPRSGTTLVEQILSSHSEVYGADELSKLHQFERSIEQKMKAGQGYPDCMSSITKKILETFANEYLGLLNSFSKEAVRITDKMPDNFLRIGLIKLMFPKAKIIHCKRNALDTCTSIFLTYFTKGNRFSFDLVEIGRYYKDYERLMSHWHSVFPGQIFDVEYEDLINDQINISRQLIDYINLEWDEACLNFYDNERTVKTASNLQVRKPIYKNSVERWKRYEQQLQPLIDVLQSDSK